MFRTFGIWGPFGSSQLARASARGMSDLTPPSCRAPGCIFRLNKHNCVPDLASCHSRLGFSLAQAHQSSRLSGAFTSLEASRAWRLNGARMTPPRRSEGLSVLHDAVERYWPAFSMVQFLGVSAWQSIKRTLRYHSDLRFCFG